ncbi:hypothetical protein TrRE_jg8283, partial [Triparma retinervis]
MMQSHVAFVNVSGLTSEVLKNVVLAGIKCTLISIGPRVVSESDAVSNLFLRKGDVGAANVEAASQARVQELNVHTTVEHHVYDDLSSFLSTLPTSGYTLLVAPALGMSVSDSQTLSSSCRASDSSLILCDSFGFHACAFLQVGGEEGHTYRKEAGKDKLSDPVTAVYPIIEGADGLDDWEGLKTRFGGVPQEWVAWMIGRMGRGKGDDWKSFAEETLTAKKLPTQYLGSQENLVSLPKALYSSPCIVPVCAVFGGQ